MADKWEDIGIMLDIEKGQNKVKSDNAGNSGDCLWEILKIYNTGIWLKKIDQSLPGLPWLKLLKCLENSLLLSILS